MRKEQAVIGQFSWPQDHEHPLKCHVGKFIAISGQHLAVWRLKMQLSVDFLKKLLGNDRLIATA